MASQWTCSALADEPVAAGPPSAVYRFRKFARRNKGSLAIAGLILFFIAVFGGGGGWFIRDRHAREEAVAKERRDREAAAERERRDREQRLTARVGLILDDVERLERQQKWPEAQAAAERAEAAIAAGEVDDAIRQRVGDALRDLKFAARLDQIRQDRATTVEGRWNWNNPGAARDYALAFREFGVDVEALPAVEAVARLLAKPALALLCAAALDDWVDAVLRLPKDAPNRKPLVLR